MVGRSTTTQSPIITAPSSQLVYVVNNRPCYHFGLEQHLFDSHPYLYPYLKHDWRRKRDVAEMTHCDALRRLEMLWDAFRRFDTLSDATRCSEKISDALRRFDTRWDASRCSERIWNVLRVRHSEMLWETLKCFETLSEYLKHFETLWEALKRSELAGQIHR